MDFIATCLGIDPKVYKYHSDKKKDDGAGGADEFGPVQNAILATETEKSLKHRSIAELKIKCPSCNAYDDF
jgi:hypothetical protein